MIEVWMVQAIEIEAQQACVELYELWQQNPAAMSEEAWESAWYRAFELWQIDSQFEHVVMCDYWKMRWALLQIQQSELSTFDKRDMQAEQLVFFLAMHAESEYIPANVLTQVIDAYIELMLQQNRPEEALALIAGMQIPLDPMPISWQQILETWRFGGAVDIHLTIAQPDAQAEPVQWHSRDALGRPIVFVIGTDGHGPSERLRREVRELLAPMALDVEVLSVVVGPLLEASRQEPAGWEVVRGTYAEEGLLAQVYVPSLPFVLVVDAQGRLLTLGNTVLAIEELQQLLLQKSKEDNGGQPQVDEELPESPKEDSSESMVIE